ncbi:hypothetical protein BBD41_15515 [Paenibacillus ihbetae]|uniref:Uncharacterized protein n=1 Tax=Paenibacillus ihbetae TaxID=1870820 RepID=A0A1B2E1N6_9BACL|nr:hypothetical protein BBD41_15515 [Paenibacillus ihbetae]
MDGLGKAQRPLKSIEDGRLQLGLSQEVPPYNKEGTALTRAVPPRRGGRSPGAKEDLLFFRAVQVHLCSGVCIRGVIARDKNLDPLALNLLAGMDIGFVVRDDRVHICNGAAFNKEI